MFEKAELIKNRDIPTSYSKAIKDLDRMTFIAGLAEVDVLVRFFDALPLEKKNAPKVLNPAFRCPSTIRSGVATGLVPLLDGNSEYQAKSF